MALRMDGDGPYQMIPADPVLAGGYIPADPVEAGLNPGETLSPDPVICAEQATRVTLLPLDPRAGGPPPEPVDPPIDPPPPADPEEDEEDDEREEAEPTRRAHGGAHKKAHGRRR